METVIADTGFVVALANRLDDRHADVAPIYAQYPKILLPQEENGVVSADLW